MKIEIYCHKCKVSRKTKKLYIDLNGHWIFQLKCGHKVGIEGKRIPISEKDCKSCDIRKCIWRTQDIEYCPKIEANKSKYKTINITGILKAFDWEIKEYKLKAKCEFDSDEKKIL